MPIMRLFMVIVVTTLTMTKTINAVQASGESLSPFGSYNAEDKCFRKTPRSFRPPIIVRSECQTPEIMREIDQQLDKYPAVQASLKRKSFNCGTAHVSDIGLEKTCATRLQLVTSIIFGDKQCYVVKPHYQCATFTPCGDERDCDGSRGTCFPDGFRFFDVWVYCKSCEFKLVRLEQPQCCSCRTFKICGERTGDVSTNL